MDLETPQQWAAYWCANNNPVTYSDPSGLVPRVDGEWAPRPGNNRFRTSSPVKSHPPIGRQSPLLTHSEIRQSMGKGLISWGAGALNAGMTMPWNTWSFLLAFSQRMLPQPVVEIPRLALIANPFANEGSYDCSYLIGFNARAGTAAETMGVASIRAGTGLDEFAGRAGATGRVADDLLPFRSNTSHIFRMEEWHLPLDTAANRATIQSAVGPDFAVLSKPVLP